MIGGANCKPTRELTEVELQDLFYGKTFQFCTGQQSRQMIPQSGPQQQRAVKNAASKEVERDMGTLQGLMLRHFREIADAKIFFSVPKSLFVKLTGQTVDLAITSGFELVDYGSALPLQDRGALGVTPSTLGSASSLPSLLTDPQQDQDEFISESVAAAQAAICLVPIPVPEPETFPWMHGEQVFFRVTHATPNRLKRPTRSIDSMRPDDLTIRLYRVCEVSSCNRKVSVQQDTFQDVWCTALLSSWNDVDGSRLVSQFLEWQVYPEAAVKLRALTDAHLPNPKRELPQTGPDSQIHGFTRAPAHEFYESLELHFAARISFHALKKHTPRSAMPNPRRSATSRRNGWSGVLPEVWQVF